MTYRQVLKNQEEVIGLERGIEQGMEWGIQLGITTRYLTFDTVP